MSGAAPGAAATAGRSMAKVLSEKTLDELAQDMHTRAEGLTHLMAKAEMELRRTKAQLRATAYHARTFNRSGGVGNVGDDCRRRRDICRPRQPPTIVAVPSARSPLNGIAPNRGPSRGSGESVVESLKKPIRQLSMMIWASRK